METKRLSRFHRIIVRDEGSLRTLQFGRTVQSTMRIGDPAEGGIEAVDLFHLPMLLRERITSALVIGLGGGSVPKQFLADYPELRLDVVELDGHVIEVATRLFGFEANGRCAVHEADGRDFIEQSTASWDLIAIDAYTTWRNRLIIPPRLVTKEFFSLCRSRLSPAGILLINVAEDRMAAITRSVARTIRTEMTHLVTFETAEDANTVLIASDDPLIADAEALAEIAATRLADHRISRPALVERARQIQPNPPMSRARVLRDADADAIRNLR